MQIVGDYIKKNENKISCFKKILIPKQINIANSYKVNSSKLNQYAADLIEFSLDIPGYKMIDKFKAQQMFRKIKPSSPKKKRKSIPILDVKKKKRKDIRKKTFIELFNFRLNERFKNYQRFYKKDNETEHDIKTTNNHPNESLITKTTKESIPIAKLKKKTLSKSRSLVSMTGNEKHYYNNISHYQKITPKIQNQKNRDQQILRKKQKSYTDREYNKMSFSSSSSKQTLNLSNLSKVIETSSQMKRKFSRILNKKLLTNKSVLFLQREKTINSERKIKTDNIEQLRKDIEFSFKKKKNKSRDDIESMKEQDKEQVKSNSVRVFIQKSHADLINFCDNYYKMEDQTVYERRKKIIQEYPILRKEANVDEKEKEPPIENKRDKNLRKNSHQMNYLYEILQKNLHLIEKKIQEFK